MKSTPPVLLAVLLTVLLPGISSAKTLSVVRRVETKEKVVALTFDADLNPRMLHLFQQHKVRSWYDKALIDELIKEKVPATLFLTGMWIELYPTKTTELSKNPLFEIGNHSYSHSAFSSPCYTLDTIPNSRDKYEIGEADRLLSLHAIRHVMLFRFPGLCHDLGDLKIVDENGYRAIGGDVFGRDGFQQNADIIVSNVTDHVRPGSIVILHMMGGPNAPKTAEALPRIIKALRNQGYHFVTVSELMKLGKKK